MIPTSIDGTDITGATIDGTDVQEITVDGDTVFSAAPQIPDEQDLHARYDATELTLSDGSPVSTWPDLSGNGHDLTAGTAPTYDDDGINNLPAVVFDKNDDEFLDVSFTSLSQPNHIFIVFKNLNQTQEGVVFDGDSSFSQALVNASGNYRLFAGGGLFDGDADFGDIIQASALFNGGSTEFRLNLGSRIATGGNIDSSVSMDGLTLGTNGSQDFGRFTNVAIGEILVYPSDKSAIVADIESYLEQRWAPFVFN